MARAKRKKFYYRMGPSGKRIRCKMPKKRRSYY